MEAIDNKYLIIVKGDGIIAAVTMREMYIRGKINVSEIITKGWTVIIKDSQHLLEDKTLSEKNSMLIFPSTFSSFEQASISLELFYYYSKDDRNCFNFYDVETGVLNYSSKEETKEKLEKAKNRYELEYISKNALMLIYADGKVESVLEQKDLDDDDNFHLFYYTELYKKSNRLRESLPDFIPYVKGQNDVNHSKIDEELISQKIAIFLNQDIGKINELRTGRLSLFNALLPKDYGSVAQAEKVEEMLKKYPEHRMLLNMWSDTEKRCTSTYLTDVLSDVAIKKELIRKEGK